MEAMKLFMVMLGATPKGRLTEQHDIFFGIGKSLKDLLPQMLAFWPEADGKIHIDAWREVSAIDGYLITVIEKQNESSDNQLFFLNLGGYRPGEFEEYHYKMLSVAPDMASAVKASKKTAFYKHYGFKGAESHIDEKYGIDVDDAFKVTDVLADADKNRFSLLITPDASAVEDELHIGYVKITKLPG